jgi:hypothetical protein
MPPKKTKPVKVDLSDTWKAVRDSKYFDEEFPTDKVNTFCKEVLMEWVILNPKADKLFDEATDGEMEELRTLFQNKLTIFSPFLSFDPYRVEWNTEKQGQNWFHKPTGLLIDKTFKVLGRVYDGDILWPCAKFTDQQKEWCKNHNLNF